MIGYAGCSLTSRLAAYNKDIVGQERIRCERFGRDIAAGFFLSDLNPRAIEARKAGGSELSGRCIRRCNLKSASSRRTGSQGQQHAGANARRRQTVGGFHAGATICDPLAFSIEKMRRETPTKRNAEKIKPRRAVGDDRNPITAIPIPINNIPIVEGSGTMKTPVAGA